MALALLDATEYPSHDGSWRTIETPDPDWHAIEEAIRRLDRYQWPFVWLHTVPPVDGEEPKHALNIMGGKGEYYLFLSEDGGETAYVDVGRGDAAIRIWESDQGSTMPEYLLCNDLERVLSIARYFAERGELDPSAAWLEE